MKKVITVIFLLFTLNTFPQSILPDYLSLKIIGEINGVVDNKKVIDNEQFVYVSPPSYYNLELVVADVKEIIDQYKDVTLTLPWSKKETNDFYSCIITVVDQSLYIRYTPDTNKLIFVYSL